MEIVIVTNRKDFYFCKLLVASIRFFYPDIKISILKEYTNGRFNTKEMERHFNVQVIYLGIDNYGWGIAKIHLMVSNYFEMGSKVLLLDADIVFIGSVLDNISAYLNLDIVINDEKIIDPKTSWYKNTYLDIDKVKQEYSEYNFPGYAFNTGQLMITAGVFKEEDFSKYLNFKTNPFWNKKYFHLFPCVDQSLLNLVVHIKESKGNIKVGKTHLYKWPEWPEFKSITLVDVLSNKHKSMLHWAGCFRSPALERMSHSEILFYFKKQYYNRLVLGIARFIIDNIYQTLKYGIYSSARKMLSFSKKPLSSN